jgi:hypothetical protein
MARHHHPPERKSFLQDRFDILIKKQKAGTASFKELTELDEIVNRDPGIRNRVLEEMHQNNFPADGDAENEVQPETTVSKLFHQLKSLVTRAFLFRLFGTKSSSRLMLT